MLWVVTIAMVELVKNIQPHYFKHVSVYILVILLQFNNLGAMSKAVGMWLNTHALVTHLEGFQDISS